MASCSPPAAIEMPAARAGEVDLRGWDWLRDGPVTLNGEWEFAWRRLPDPDAPAFFDGGGPGAARTYVRVPHIWRNTPAAGHATYGFATYELRLRLPPSEADAHATGENARPTARFALRIPDLNTAYRLYAGPELLCEVGRVATDAPQYKPAFEPKVVALPASGDIRLRLQIANFVHGKGGLDESISLGTLPQMLAWQEYDRNLAVFTFAALGFMGLYQWIQYLLRRVDSRPFWFGLFCLCLSMRSVVTGEYLLARWIAPLPFGLLLTLEYLTLVVGTMAIGLYLARLLPAEFHAWFPALMKALGLSYAALMIVTPLGWGHDLITVFQLFSVTTIVFCAIRVSVGVHRGRDGAMGTLVGGLIVSAAVILDILISHRIVESSMLSDVTPFAMLVFVLFQAYTLSRRSARAFATAERLSVELEDRVRRRTRDLEAARLQSEAANRTKSEFLATMSHELRTPLNSIIGTADLLGESELNDGQREFVRVLNRAAHHLLQQVDRILDLSRVEAGKLELVPAPVDLPVFVEEAMVDLRRAAAEKAQLTLTSRVESRDLRPDEDLVLVDATRLRQILDNLIGNAIKFTSAGEIRLTVYVLSRTADSVNLLFEVEDSGIGIPREKQTQIFESFSQLDSSNTRPYQGTGLGLAIVRRLVELMGGEIGVESEVGHGSRFWFRVRLPVVSRAEAARIEEQRRRGASGGVPGTGGRADGGSPPAFRPGARPAGPIILRQGLRVLIAEDNPDNYFLVRKFLEKSGVELLHASNGREALDLVAEPDVDLILMDLQMPVMDGYEATRRIREREKQNDLPAIPILALTANTTREDMARTRAGGFDGHLSKPIRKSELLAAVAWYSRRGPGQGS